MSQEWLPTHVLPSSHETIVRPTWPCAMNIATLPDAATSTAGTASMFATAAARWHAATTTRARTRFMSVVLRALRDPAAHGVAVLRRERRAAVARHPRAAVVDRARGRVRALVGVHLVHEEALAPRPGGHQRHGRQR